MNGGMSQGFWEVMGALQRAADDVFLEEMVFILSLIGRKKAGLAT